MSLDPTSPVSTGANVRPILKTSQSTEDTQALHLQDTNSNEPHQLTNSQKNEVITDFYQSNSMSTEGFLLLKEQTEDPFELLDMAIQKMKENSKIAADFFDKVLEASKETATQNMALQILQKTLEGLSSSEE